MTEPTGIYLAGPMRGHPHNNFPAFHAAESEIRRLMPDAEIVNPAALDEAAGFTGDHEPDGDFMRAAMERDLVAICRCTHIALMAGWEQSEGAGVEMGLAVLLGLSKLHQRPDGWAVGTEQGYVRIPAAKGETILEEAQRITSGDRDRQYGHPRLHWSRTVGAINAMFGTSFEPHEWGYCMILDKLAREQNGHKRDNLTDCAGYARCVERCLEVE